MMKRRGLMVLALMLAAHCLAEGAGRELSGYFGREIAGAAAELGGLSFEAGEEFSENYMSDALALRGNGGVVKLIQLKSGATDDTLCGIKCGMTREEALTLMNGCKASQIETILGYTYGDEVIHHDFMILN